MDTCACIIISHNQLIMLHTAWPRIRRKEWYIINSWKYTLVILDYGSFGDWNCLATGFRLIDVVYFRIKRYTLEWWYNADFSRSLNAPVFQTTFLHVTFWHTLKILYVDFDNYSTLLKYRSFSSRLIEWCYILKYYEYIIIVPYTTTKSETWWINVWFG